MVVILQHLVCSVLIVCVSPYVMLVSFSAHWIIWRHLPSPWLQTSNITVWARRQRTTTGFIRACLQKTCIRPCRDTKMHGAASSCEWSCLCITINTLKLLVITSRPFYIFFYPVPLLYDRRVPCGTWKLASSSSLQKN